MDYGRPTSELIRIFLALGGVGLVVAWFQLKAPLRRALLIALLVVSGLNFARMGPNLLLRQVDSYDLIHYYLNAKYFDELGYFDLYSAALLVDHDNKPYDPRIEFYRAQDAERGYRYPVKLDEGIARGRIVRDEKFTHERWKQFEYDFLYIQRDMQLGRGLWRELLGDRGFNGTPVWLLVGKPLAHLVPVEGVKVLCFIDVSLLILALFFIQKAYGTTTSLFALLFFFLTYSMRWPVPSHAFLRYDWLASLLIGMSLVKLGRHKLAGVLTAYAALVRLFPIVWMFGPFARGVTALVWPRGADGAEISSTSDGKKGSAAKKSAPLVMPFMARVDKRLVGMAIAFLLSAGAMEGLAVVVYGTDSVRAHTEKLSEHIKPEELSSRRIGLALALSYDGELLPKNIPHERKMKIKAQSGARTALALFILVVLAFGTRRLSDDLAYGLGFLPFFLLSTASYYYYVARVTLIVVHASDLSKLRNRFGLAWLLALEALTHFAETAHPGHRVYLIGHLAWGLAAYAIILAFWLAYEAYTGRDIGVIVDDDTALSGERMTGGPENAPASRSAT